MRSTVAWQSQRLTPTYVSVVLGLGRSAPPTHVLHVYGFKDQREKVVEHAAAGLALWPEIVHHRRLRTRAILTRRIDEPVLNPELGWQHVAFYAAIFTVLGITLYNTLTRL